MTHSFIGASTKRVVVVQAEAPMDVGKLVVPVGVIRYEQDHRDALGVIVKLTLALADEGGVLTLARPAAEQRPLSVDVPSRFPSDQPDALDYASDFAPHKPNAELTVVGHAYPAQVTQRSDASIGVTDAIYCAFTAAVGAPAVRIPLAYPYIESSNLPGRLGPRATPGRFAEGMLNVTPWDVYQVAPPNLRRTSPSWPSNAELTLGNLLSGGGGHVVTLPGLDVVVTVDDIQGDGRPVDMLLDTIHIDTDTAEAVLIWRGRHDVVEGETDIERIVVSVEHQDQPRSPEDRLAALQRGHVAFALTEKDAATGELPPDEDARLTLARYATWAGPAPEPRLPLERYAWMSAEMAERPEAREEVLARNEIDEYTYNIEERAWLELFASEGLKGGATLATAFGEHYLKAQEALVTPEEQAMSMRDYAKIVVQMERATDPNTVLEHHKMPVSRWLRIDRRFKLLVAADAQAQEQLDKDLEEVRTTGAYDTEGGGSGTAPPPADDTGTMPPPPDGGGGA